MREASCFKFRIVKFNGKTRRDLVECEKASIQSDQDAVKHRTKRVCSKTFIA